MKAFRSVVFGGVILLSGCSLSVNAGTPTTPYSEHTLQELCDFAKPFFILQSGAVNLRIGLLLSMPMSRKIEAGNGCFYHQSDEEGGRYLGNTYLRQERQSQTSQADDSTAVRHINVDGVSVAQMVLPVPELQDQATTRPPYKLFAKIDGWESSLVFYQGDDASSEAAAKVVVGMVRALTG
ncbi:hypothetical protein [Nocardia australiensis]|uniref:hypothetical protein n=1 Tax=Nocardia australiensis TaxID=2887191 RepID=UPI001D14AF8B|nr:hypothetical protein [Nocardia australiensis]